MGQFRAFCGPSYNAISPTEDVEQAINLYCETIESGNGKNTQILIGTPGTQLHCTLPKSPIRGVFSQFARLFVVAGDTLYEVFDNGTFTPRGTVSIELGVNFPCSFAQNNANEICVISNRRGYIFNTLANTLTEITAPGFLGANTVVFIDGYFVCSKPDSNTVFFSGIEDGLSWDALDFFNCEGASGNIISIGTNFRELWAICETHTEVFYNSGDANNPWQRASGGFIEKGGASAVASSQLDNSIFWVSNEKQVLRTNGYQPVRVSNFAVENALRKFTNGDILLSESFYYSEAGHVFYVLSFANETWCYDVSNGQWHQRATLSGGVLNKWTVRGCASMGWVNYVGDWNSGNVYRMSLDYYTENGNPIKRVRTCPHITNELKRSFYDQFEIDAQVGVGLDVASGQPGYDPQVSLFVSRDGGRTWGPELLASLGKMGEYRKRVVWRRLGRARDMVFRVECTDPVKIAWVNAYLEVRPGN